MTISERTIRHVLAKTTDAKAVAQLLQFYESVQQQRRKLYAEREKVRKDYENELRQIDKAEWDNQQRCDHPDTEYHADPSGGQDSCTTCLICGAEL